jgi:HlyD family secretion protein
MFGRLVGWVRRHPVWSVLIALLIAGVVYKVVAPKPKSYEYVSEAVGRGDVVRTVTASGKLRALNTIKVGAEVSGQVTRVMVDYNSIVHAGQVLAEIDPTRVKARVQQAQAQVALAQAALATAEANAMRARTDLEVQGRDFERQKELVRRGFVSRGKFDASTNLVSSSRASVRSTQAQIASARAQISQSSAELSSAMLDLRRTVIVAPTSGVIINKLVEPGTTVVASFQTPNLFEIAADTTRMQVEASVDEADIGQVRDGQSVSFTVDAYPDSRFPATVRQIRKAATEAQNVVSYLVILDVANEDGKLLPGMTANVEILTGEADNVVRVPSGALRFRPRSTDQKTEDGGNKGVREEAVYVETSDIYKPQRRVLQIGLQGEDFVEVISGLKTGEKILTRSRSLKPKTTKSNEDEDDSAPQHPSV